MPEGIVKTPSGGGKQLRSWKNAYGVGKTHRVFGKMPKGVFLYLLLDLGRLSDTVAQIVELRTPDLSLSYHLDLVDPR